MLSASQGSQVHNDKYLYQAGSKEGSTSIWPTSAILSQTTYLWRVAAVNANKVVGGTITTGDSSEVRQFTTVSGVDGESFDLPEYFVLRAAYPNPVNPTTTVTYGLSTTAEVSFPATESLGRQVATLVAGDMQAAGYHTVQFNADDLAYGAYLIRMEAAGFVATQQVVFLRYCKFSGYSRRSNARIFGLGFGAQA